jgi:hypothetical protein
MMAFGGLRCAVHLVGQPFPGARVGCCDLMEDAGNQDRRVRGSKRIWGYYHRSPASLRFPARFAEKALPVSSRPWIRPDHQ